MRFMRMGKKFVVYSIGMDRVDNNGAKRGDPKIGPDDQDVTFTFDRSRQN